MIINHNMRSLYADRVLNVSNDNMLKNSLPAKKLIVLEMTHQDLQFLKKCAHKFAV